MKRQTGTFKQASPTIKITRSALSTGVLITFLGGLVSGCSLPVPAPAPTTPAVQSDNASPATRDRQTTISSSNNASSNNASESFNTRLSQTAQYSPGRNISCVGQTHYANITWDAGEPYIEFGRLPASIILNSPAFINRDSNGSVTFSNRRGENTVSARFEASGRCTLRSVSASGQVTVNQSGRITNGGTGGGSGGGTGGGSGGGTGGSNGGTVNRGYWEGYDRGYQDGYQAGRSDRFSGAGYYPDQAFRQNRTPNGNREFLRGYEDGFFAGYREGYYSTAERPERPGRPARW